MERRTSTSSFLSSGISQGCSLPSTFFLASLLIRLMKPTNLPSASLKGICKGATDLPNFTRISANVFSKSAFSSSIWFTKKIRGRCISSVYSHAFSVPTSTPALPETTMIAASAALTASSTSPTKSKYPGVSSTLIFTLSHGTGINVVEMEKCLLISSLS